MSRAFKPSTSESARRPIVYRHFFASYSRFQFFSRLASKVEEMRKWTCYVRSMYIIRQGWHFTRAGRLLGTRNENFFSFARFWLDFTAVLHWILPKGNVKISLENRPPGPDSLQQPNNTTICRFCANDRCSQRLSCFIIALLLDINLEFKISPPIFHIPCCKRVQCKHGCQK